MADVFVSYKREDAARVKKLVAALRETGLDAWWDEDIAPSAPWEATIEKALRDAKAVIVCWSPDAVGSENVRSEARVAREDGRLIQVFMKPCSPPLFFGERQGVDLSSWRGKADDPRIAKIAESIRAVAAGQKPHVAPAATVRRWFNTPVHVAIAALILLAGSLAGWWLMSPAKAQGPQTLAVLPFRALNSADANLVDAIWDDTRGAISKNPNLRVLGRESVKALAEKGLEPADYRKKVGADYLLDGSVEHVGDQVRIKVNLTRTRDATEVWSDEVGGKLDNVFAFQQRVAREVEGRIRGRVAPGGGVVAKNITTSGEVYAIYADGRAAARHRDREGLKKSIALFRRAVAMDPNFAPAWAQLAISTKLYGGPRPFDEIIAEAVGYLKRALTLAPNLAAAHAGLAMVQDLPPELEPELRRALDLDPNDAEAWMWLGSTYNGQGKHREALREYDRTLEIDPLFWPAIGNKINTLGEIDDQKALSAELQRVAATGDSNTLLKAQAFVAGVRKQIGESVGLLLHLRAQAPDEASWVDVRIGRELMTLGFIEEALEAMGQPLEIAPNYRGIPDPPQIIKADLKRPVEFWMGGDEATVFARLLPKHGRLREFVGYYTSAFKSADQLADALPNRPLLYLTYVPNTAVNLRAGGQAEQAEQLLASADSLLASKMRDQPKDTSLRVYLAQLRAAQGRDEEVVPSLSIAFSDGWLPDRMLFASDISDEPCFAHLVNRPDFRAIRQRILARIEEERRKVPLNLLHRAYPLPANTKQIAA